MNPIQLNTTDDSSQPLIDGERKATPSASFLTAVELLVGQPIEKNRQTPIEDLRRKVELDQGKPISFISIFPFIGRGHVLRDRITDHQKVERLLDEALL